MNPTFPSVIELLLKFSQKSPEKKIFTYYGDDKSVISSLTYAQLEENTRHIASQLLRAKTSSILLKPGDRVILVYLPSLDFIVSFIACLRAGLLPVPVYPPDPRNLRVNISLFASVVSSSGAKVALSHSSYQKMVSLASLKDSASRLFSRGDNKIEWPELYWINTDGNSISGSKLHLSSKLNVDLVVVPAPDAVAFLQFTSGSTSEPKGVIVTHQNLSSNLSIIHSKLRASEKTTVVSWLPQYHDMGLIGSYLGVMTCGGDGHYISPLSFIKNPVLWLELLSSCRATHTQAPNFAYSLVARKFLQSLLHSQGRSNIDLSNLEHIFNAAEAVTLSSMRAFYTVLKPFGLKPTAFSPGYGLAENTVYVCDGGSIVLSVDRVVLEREGRIVVRKRNELTALLDLSPASPELSHFVPGPTTAVLVSCGPVYPYSGTSDGVAVAIVSRDGSDGEKEKASEKEDEICVLGPDAVGDVFVSSASTAQGYWGRPELTASAFRQRLPPFSFKDKDRSLEAAFRALSASPSFLRTGDIGFVEQGQLFLCGRAKDLLISRGRNFFPQDLEHALETSFAWLRPGCSAVFAPPGPERVVVAVELRAGGPARTSSTEGDSLATFAQEARALLIREFGLSPAALLLLAPGGTRKTTSGKVARAWNGRAFNEWENGSGPWSTPGVVLFADLAPVSGPVEGDEYDDSNGADIAQDVSRDSLSRQELQFDDNFSSMVPRSSATPAAAFAAGAPTEAAMERSMPPPTSAKRRGRFVTVEGENLKAALRKAVGEGLHLPENQVQSAIALSFLGFDSLALAQFQARLEGEFGLIVPDAAMFAEFMSIDWLVEHAYQLRNGQQEAAVQEASQNLSQGHTPRSGNVAEVERRQGLSKMETNCPCFVWCCGG